MSEKRYFKIFAKRHVLGSQNKYVALFERLDAMAQEDNTKLIDAMSQLGYKNANLAADKNYLAQLLQRALNAFYNEQNISLKIKSNLQTIEILFHKGLYHECLKLIRKTEKLIEEGEYYTLQIDLIIWKRKCSGYAYGLKKAQEVNLEMDYCIHKVNNLKDIVDIYYTTYIEKLKWQSDPSDKLEKVFGQLFQQPVMHEPTENMTVQAQIFHQLCFAHYYFLGNDYPKEYNALKAVAKIIQQNPVYERENLMDCVALYNRLLNASKYFEQDTFYTDLQYLSSFNTEGSFIPQVLKQRIFIHISTAELDFLMIHGQFQQAYGMAEGISSRVSSFTFPIEPYYDVQLRHALMKVYIIQGLYSEALDIANELNNRFSFNDNPHAFFQAQILNSMCHYCLGNRVMLANTIPNLLIKYKKEFSSRHFERSFLRLLHKSMLDVNLMNNSKRNDFFERFCQKYNPQQSLNNQDTDNPILYTMWLKALIQNKPIAQIF